MSIELEQPDAESLATAVREMLAGIGHAANCRIERIPGGRNNRVYRVETAAEPCFLKEYFYATAADRDRLAAEFAFCDFAWNAGVRAVPRPLAKDATRHVALYEWIDGVPIAAGELNESHIATAMSFLLDLNARRDHPLAGKLPNAAEACFSIREHLDCVRRRIARLEGLPGSAPIDRKAAEFVRTELRPAFAHREAAILSNLDNVDERVVDRWVSPSDFGFHNVLLENVGRIVNPSVQASQPRVGTGGLTIRPTATGGLRFFDFEYAGWDDPAKTVCDFFCQPRVPVPVEYLPRFVDALTAVHFRPAEFRARVDALLPLYRIKWCGIMMNEFLPEDARRREFGGRPTTSERKSEQLAAAREFLRTTD